VTEIRRKSKVNYHNNGTVRHEGVSYILSLCIIVRNSPEQIYIYKCISIFIHRKRRVSLCARSLLFFGWKHHIHANCDGSERGDKGGKGIYIYNIYVKFGRDVSSGCRKRAESPADFGSGQYARAGLKKKKKAYRAFFLLYTLYYIYNFRASVYLFAHWHSQTDKDTQQ